MPFDRLVLQETNRTQVIPLDVFLTMPLHERTRFILERRISFFLGEAPVDRRVALRAIMRAAQVASQTG